MQLKSRYFTYPVISTGNNFYADSSFKTDVESSLDGYNINFSLKAKLQNKELEEMLEKGEVIIAHHIECPQTCFRKLYTTKKETEIISIKDNQVNGLVQVCSFLVANENISEYSNKLLKREYSGLKFDIEKGCIMAIGNQIDLRINKIRDDLVNTTSIFSIIANYDPTVMEIKINLTDNKIAIVIPEKTFGIYKNMSGYLAIQPVMHSMFIIPALMHTFYELKDSKELYMYEDYRWFRALRKACIDMDVEINEVSLKSLDIFLISQKLMDSPIVKGIDFLMGAGDENNEN